MSYNFHQLNQHEQDECLSKGICSLSPVLISLHEVIMLHLRDLSFFLLELKNEGVENAQLKEQVIEILSSLIVNVEYTPEQFKVVLDRLHDGLSQAKALYIELCKKNGTSSAYVSEVPKRGRKFNFSDVIREGQKEHKKKCKKYTKDEKLLLEVLFMLIKSICIHLVELKSYDFDDTEIYYCILELIKLMNNPQEFSPLQQKEKEKFITLDASLLIELYERKKQRFGEIVPVDVSFSIRPNKAILVAGDNLVDLELLLKATENTGIDIYTHGKMIMAHSYPKLKAYTHLVGHFGRGAESGLVDFAAFPGAIFMTKLSLQRVERLYRSRIFTTDVLAPKGVIIIKDDDYSPLIESALSAKGFINPQQKHSVRVGFCEKEILDKISEVAEKMKEKEIRHFFAIGIANGTHVQSEYFENFLSMIPEDCFVLSFSYTNEEENVLLVPTESGVAILYKAIKILSKNISMPELNISILYTRCEYHTIPNLLNMSFLGARDIYFPLCSPHLIKPELVDYIMEKYEINCYTNPRSDIQRMLSQDDN